MQENQSLEEINSELYMKNIFLVEQVNQMEFNAEHNESIMEAMNEANESLEEKLKSL